MTTDRETQLLQAAYQTGMTSPKKLANFMAQVSAESGGLNQLEESFRYTKNISQIPVKYAHHEGDAALEAARVNALKGQPEELGFARLRRARRAGFPIEANRPRTNRRGGKHDDGTKRRGRRTDQAAGAGANTSRPCAIASRSGDVDVNVSDYTVQYVGSTLLNKLSNGTINLSADGLNSMALQQGRSR